MKKIRRSKVLGKLLLGWGAVGLSACGVRLTDLTPAGINPYAKVEHSYSCAETQVTAAPQITVKTAASSEAPYPYLEAIPASLDPTEKLPLIFYFHDYTEQGVGADASEIQTQLSRHGPFKRIQEGKNFKAIVVAPQSAEWWDQDRVRSFFHWALVQYPVNLSRVYITGNGAGGAAVWGLIRTEYARIAAALPIAGGDALFMEGRPEEWWALKNVPHLVIHNFKDNIMGWGNSQSFGNGVGRSFLAKNTLHASNDESRTMTQYLAKAPAEWRSRAGFSLRDESGQFLNRHFMYVFRAEIGTVSGPRVMPEHDAWTAAYESEDVWSWMFCQAKPSALKNARSGAQSGAQK